MNACGHHHVGHIGILGVEKRGEEWYQITLGGSASGQVSLGEVIGPSVPQAAVAQTIATILAVYVEQREAAQETFLQTVRRIGVEPFRERVYATDH
jgi:sulfite reductase (NADPH) hemoprotein beta-component